MVYYVEIYDFELNPDSSMSSEEVKEYAESANLETVRHYSFTDLRKAKRSFEIAKEAAVAEKNEDNKCICKAFREQCADPEFEGWCHCMLYYKSK